MRLEKINLLFSVKVGKNKIFNIKESKAVLLEVYRNDRGSFSARKLSRRPNDTYRGFPCLINLNDEYVFVLGGARRSKMYSVFNTVACYDLATNDAPIAYPEMNAPRMQASGCALNGSLYVFGGKNNPQTMQPLNFIERLQNPL